MKFTGIKFARIEFDCNGRSRFCPEFWGLILTRHQKAKPQTLCKNHQKIIKGMIVNVGIAISSPQERQIIPVGNPDPR